MQPRLRDDGRAVSSTISVILLVAIVVIAASAVGVYVMGIGETALGDEKQPQGAFDFEYNTDSANLTITYTGGDGIEPDRVDVVGPGAGGDQFTEEEHGDTLTAGDSVTIPFAQYGDDYRIVWETEQQSATLATYTPPAGVDYVFEFDPTVDEDSVDVFEDKFDREDDRGIVYKNKSDTMQVNQQSTPSYTRWSADLGEPRENVTIDLSLDTNSLNGGVGVYVVTTSGEKKQVYCHNPGADDEPDAFLCDSASTPSVDRTYTVAYDEGIERVVFHYDPADGAEWTELRHLKIAD